MLHWLQAQPWVRSHYTLVASKCDPYGQVTLVKGQVRAASQLVLTQHKKALAVTVAVAVAAEDAQPAPHTGAVANVGVGVAPTGGGAALEDAPSAGSVAITPTDANAPRVEAGSSDATPASVAPGIADGADEGLQEVYLDIWNVHLPAAQRNAGGGSSTGGRGGLGGGRGSASIVLSRDQQLQRIAEAAVRSESHWCVVGGDFNAAGQQGRDTVPFQVTGEAGGWRDAWVLARGYGQESEVEGVTFDPGSNPLAKHNSTSGMAARFDRVMVLGAGLEVSNCLVH